jgi:NitT/TauT family transport system substrate-binding protein
MKSWMSVAVGVALILTGCNTASRYEAPLVVSTDTWIGAAPLYYAHAKGWLKEANIEMLQTDSIDENLRLYDKNASDVITGTEHEYLRLKKIHNDIIPIIIYDRSYGGDVVFSNNTIEQLKQSKEKIDVFLELDTVGEDMLDYFIAEHNLTHEQFNVYNRSQEEIENIDNSNVKKPLLCVTYNPHDLVLKKRGLQEVASSKNDAYVVVDSFMTSRKTYVQHKEQLQTLAMLMKKAVASYHDDPKLFYMTVKPYLNSPSFEEFEQMSTHIQWINKQSITPKMKQKLEKLKYPVSELIE